MILSRARCTYGENILGSQRRNFSDADLWDIEDLLSRKGINHNVNEAISFVSGRSYSDLARAHRQGYNLDQEGSEDTFIAVCFAVPDIYINNLIGCELAGNHFREIDLVGVTCQGAGTLHKLLRLLHTTRYCRQQGRIWLFDQYSPLYNRPTGLPGGRDSVFTIEVNRDTTGWSYIDTSRRHVTSTPFDADQGKDVKEDSWTAVESWMQLATPFFEVDDDYNSVIDYDPENQVQWQSRFRRVA